MHRGTGQAFRARWCIDIKYGVKMDALALVSEWVQNIGSQAGLTDNVHILSGAVGVPESRISRYVSDGHCRQSSAACEQISEWHVALHMSAICTTTLPF